MRIVKNETKGKRKKETEKVEKGRKETEEVEKEDNGKDV